MVRKAAVQILDATPAALKSVLQELRRQDWPVFKRLELYLLNRYSDAGMDEITPLATGLATVEGSTHREAAQLLNHVFAD